MQAYLLFLICIKWRVTVLTHIQCTAFRAMILVMMTMMVAVESQVRLVSHKSTYVYYAIMMMNSETSCSVL